MKKGENNKNKSRNKYKHKVKENWFLKESYKIDEIVRLIHKEMSDNKILISTVEEVSLLCTFQTLYRK